MDGGLSSCGGCSMQELSRQAVIGMSSRGTNKEREALHVSVLTMYCKCTVPRHLHSRQTERPRIRTSLRCVKNDDQRLHVYIHTVHALCKPMMLPTSDIQSEPLAESVIFTPSARLRSMLISKRSPRRGSLFSDLLSTHPRCLGSFGGLTFSIFPFCRAATYTL